MQVVQRHDDLSLLGDTLIALGLLSGPVSRGLGDPGDAFARQAAQLLVDLRYLAQNARQASRLIPFRDGISSPQLQNVGVVRLEVGAFQLLLGATVDHQQRGVRALVVGSGTLQLLLGLGYHLFESLAMGEYLERKRSVGWLIVIVHCGRRGGSF